MSIILRLVEGFADCNCTSKINARMLDRIYVYFKTRNDGKGEPEFRLREWASMHCAAARAHDTAASMVPGTILLPAGLIITGWAAQKGVHWIVVDIVSAVPLHIIHSLTSYFVPQGLFLVGGGMILNFQCIQTYVIDAFTLHAASGLAAVSFLRSLAGYVLCSFVRRARARSCDDCAFACTTLACSTPRRVRC